MYVAPSAGSGAGGGNLFFMRGEALMAQPFDTGRLELTGRAVQVADRVSTNTFDGLFSVSNNGILAYAATGGENRQLTWYDREGKVVGHAGEAACARRTGAVAGRNTSGGGPGRTNAGRGEYGCWIWRAASIRASASMPAAAAQPGRRMARRLCTRRAEASRRTCIASLPTGRARARCCFTPTESRRPTTGRATAVS